MLNFAVDDVSGVCLPAPASAAVDILRPMLALQLARRLETELSKAKKRAARGSARRGLELLEESVHGLDPIACASAFDPLPVTADIPIDPEEPDPRPDQARHLACLRYLVGAGQTSLKSALPLAANMFAEDGAFYVPHMRVILRNIQGPVLVAEKSSNTCFTWSDGFSLTLPKRTPGELPEGGDSHFRIVPSIFGVPVLNQVGEATRRVADLEPCTEAETAAAAVRLAEGLGLLREVWPTAFHSALGQLKGFIVLRSRDHTRSHSPRSLLGLIALSVGDAVSTADLIVHESSHIRLNLIRQFEPLWTDREPSRLHESPWRPDLRPLLGIVFGVHAFLNVALYYRRVATWAGGNAVAEMLFERQRTKVRSAWETVKHFAQPTVSGESFLAELEREVHAL